MQATGLRTGQPAINRGFIGAMLVVVATAAVVAALIVGTALRPAVGPTAAPDPGAVNDALIQFRADERASLGSLDGTDASTRALIQLRADERADRAAAVNAKGMADYYASSRDANNAWTKGTAGHGGKFAK